MPLKRLSPEDVREWRVDSRLTLKQFAGMLGVAVHTVQAWEKGLKRPSMGIALARRGWYEVKRCS